MYIGGTVISSVEFHGNMSLVIFMSKCPLACRYCHNVELLEDNTQKTFEEVKSKIDNAADFIDAVVISGGEPLMQLDSLIELFTYVKSIGLKTKLDTSGIYPDKIEKLLELKLLDFVSLDVKAPFEKYRKVTGSNVVVSYVNPSVTLYEDITAEDYLTMALNRYEGLIIKRVPFLGDQWACLDIPADQNPAGRRVCYAKRVDKIIVLVTFTMQDEQDLAEAQQIFTRLQ